MSLGLLDALRWLSEIMAGVFAMSFWTPEAMVWVSVASWRTAGMVASVVITTAF